MSKEEAGAQIIEAHQELVEHIEASARRIRALSGITIVVSVLLVGSYALQLALPLTGTTSVTVKLNDPGTVAVELVVLALVLAWLYVGLSDFRFSGRVGKGIRTARAQEKELRGRTPEARPDS